MIVLSVDIQLFKCRSSILLICSFFLHVSKMPSVQMAKRKFTAELLGAECSQNHHRICVSGAPQIKRYPSPLWKLNIDCIYEIFDYLGLDDIIAIGATCKIMQHVAGLFIREKFTAKRKTFTNDSIYMDWTPRWISTYTEYLDSIYIDGNSSSAFRYLSGKNMKNIREIRLTHIDFTDYEIDCVKQCLNGVEILEIDLCTMKMEFYENFLKFCPKLKSLSVSRSSYDRDGGIIIGPDNDWLQRTYPSTLEHVELTDLYELRHNELRNFLQLNRNVRSFSIDAKSLMLNQDQVLAAAANDVIVDKLAIDFHPHAINAEIEPAIIAQLFYNFLIELQECQFFAELHLYVKFMDHQNCMQKLYSLNTLTMLGGYIDRIENPLMRVKELDISMGSDILDLQTLPEKLPNLERIHFAKATVDHILPFIRFSPRLKQVKCGDLSDGMHMIGGILDVDALNNQRKELPNARKVTIYVNEAVFLATKWARKGAMHFDLVELRRGESILWNGLNSSAKFVRSF